MILYPAMDLMGGRVVRLRQGRFEQSTFYPVRPREAVRKFADAGAEWVHVVDLDGARAGTPVQHGLIAELASEGSVRLQVGGGFRTRREVAWMLDAGVERVVIGSLSVREPQRVRDFMDEFGPDRIALALDVRVAGDEPLVATAGWQQESGRSLWDVAALFPPARHMLITDIDRDGMLDGPNLELLDEAVERLSGISIQASGGISSLDDLRRLRTAGAIVGRAMWEGLVDLGDALHACA